jgi:transcription elongation factor
MFTTDAGSRTRQATGMRPILATAAIATAIVSVLAITPPAFARSDTGGAGLVSGTNSSGSRQPSYSPSRAANVNSSGAHYLNGTGSARQFSSSGGRRAGIAVAHHQVGPDMARSEVGTVEICLPG